MMNFKSIRVNLSSGEIKTEPVDERFVRDFIGGRGFGAVQLYRDMKAGIDPLGEDNKMLFLTGPLAGGPLQSTSRWMVYTKSPLTGALVRSCGGADFGAWLRFSGYSFIEIEGKADKPVYIHLTADSCKILDASQLWGKNIDQTQEWLQEKHGKNTRCAVIGVAGEKLVRYAGIFSDRRSASRCGGGTVMGSKNLKAIAINAERKLVFADAEAMKQAAKDQIEAYKNNPGYHNHREWGTTSTQDVTNTLGIYPVKNFREGRSENWEKTLVGEEYKKIRTGEFACYSCMVRCGKAHTVPSGPYAGAKSDGPEYESIWAFTGPIGSTDINASVAADALCDELGIDTISAGNCVGFAFELFEKGILTKADTGGMDLTYGNHQAMVQLLRMIGNREGLGHILAEGVMRAAQIIGKGSEAYAIHCKGMEPPAYEPRGAKNQGFNYATSNIGASHCYGYAAQDVFGVPFPHKVDRFEEGNADIVVYNQNGVATSEVGIVCNFAERWGWVPEIFGRALAAATGIEECKDPAYLNMVGDRIMNMERAFIAREGFGRAQDTLPSRILNEELVVDGVAIKGARVKDLQGFLDRYYALRGWSANGTPTAEKLSKLGIGYAVK